MRPIVNNNCNNRMIGIKVETLKCPTYPQHTLSTKPTTMVREPAKTALTGSNSIETTALISALFAVTAHTATCFRKSQKRDQAGKIRRT
jgi:hypothetical protein